MKHKFKPSVSGNRGKRGASGGGTKEKQSDNPPPASPVIHHEQTRGQTYLVISPLLFSASVYVYHHCLMVQIMHHRLMSRQPAMLSMRVKQYAR